MGTLAIGMSVMLLIYAIFLYITYKYFFSEEKPKYEKNKWIKKLLKF